MRIGLAQINPRIGALEENTEKILNYIDQAKGAGISVLVFPELSVSGYPPRDLLDSNLFLEKQMNCLRRIEQVADNMLVFVGYVEKNTKAGCPFFNAVAALSEAKTTATYRKQLIPNYDIFDEARYFEPGDSPLILEYQGLRLGVSVCEDIWNFPQFTQRYYASNPVEHYVGKNIDCLINLSASPYRLGKERLRFELLETVAKKIQAPVALCNQVGANDELLFDGGSAFVNASGNPIGLAKAFQEDLISIEASQLKHAPGLASETLSDMHGIASALEMGIRDYVRKCGGKTVGLGLSGGIDSSVVACLATRALGSENVWGLSLPTRFTSQASLEDARSLALLLKINFSEIPIDSLFEGYLQVWESAFKEPPKTLTFENLQPRIRMTILMGVANDRESFLLNTSNKSEIAAGYSTLYGDSAGALSVLGDLNKAQVYQLGRYLNQQGAGIPDRVFERAPTAELREGQKDADRLPPYDVLDALVARTLEGNPPERPIDPKWEQVFEQLYDPSEHKRWQFPPVLRVSSRAFGVGRRMPIAAKRHL